MAANKQAWDDFSSVVGAVAHDDLGLRLYRDVEPVSGSEDTLGADACLIQVHFAFTMDKLGQPT